MARRGKDVRLTDAELISWLRLIRSDNVGPRTFRSLLAQFGTAQAALEALPELARRGGRLLIKVCEKAEAEAEIAQAMNLGIRFVALKDSAYPTPLKTIDDAPPLLAVRGDDAVLSKPMVAIVGSRNASAAGLRMTEILAKDLGKAGFIIASGLARGVDTRAHQASLQTGTVAVIAGGHERIYPAQNIPLTEAIIENGGAVITEMPLYWEPRAQDFPRRNRIVSGLSYGVIVVEAAKRSGSLITTRLGLEQGREIFAVPGSPLDPRAEGPNDLIRQGATLCGQADHVLEVLEPIIGQAGLALEEQPTLYERDTQEPFLGNFPTSDETARIGEFLSSTPVPVDDLVRMAETPLRVVQVALLELEIAGRLKRYSGNRVAISV